MPQEQYEHYPVKKLNAGFYRYNPKFVHKYYTQKKVENVHATGFDRYIDPIQPDESSQHLLDVINDPVFCQDLLNNLLVDLFYLNNDEVEGEGAFNNEDDEIEQLSQIL